MNVKLNNSVLKRASALLITVMMLLSMGSAALAEGTGTLIITPCDGGENCAALTHEDGCLSQQSGEGDDTPTVTCTNAADCPAETHEADCPKYVSPTPTCDGSENCAAATHNDGCLSQQDGEDDGTPVTCTKGEDCPATEHEADCLSQQSGDDPDPTPDNNSEPSAEVTAIQTRINALPDAASIAAMGLDEQNAVYNEVTAIYGAIDALTGDADSLDTTKLDAAAAVFAANASGLIAPVAFIDQNDNGTQDEGETYETLTAAITAANDIEGGATVTLLADHEIQSTVIIEQNITLDLNGKTITAAVGVDPMFRIHADVTVTGSGTVDARNGVAYCFILGKPDGTVGNLTIKNGSYYGETTVASVTKGTLTVEGGEFSVNPYNGSYDFLLNCIDASYRDGTAKIVVKGGTFHNFDPSDNAAEVANTNFVPEELASQAGSADDGTFVIVPAVASVDGKGYASLSAAIADNNTGANLEVTLFGTAKLNEIKNLGSIKNLTIKGSDVTKAIMDICDQEVHTAAGLSVTFDTVTITGHTQWNYKGLRSGPVKESYLNCVINGTLTVHADEVYVSNCDFKSDATNGDGDYSLFTYGVGKITVEECDFDVYERAVKLYNEQGYSTVAAFTECNFTSATKDKAAIEITSQYDTTKYTVTITDCTATGFGGAEHNGAADNALWNYEDVYLNGSAKPSSSGAVTVEGTKVYPAYVAEVNGEQYESIPEAIAAAQTGDTVKLIKAVSITESVVITKDITLDMGGYTITAATTADPAIRVQSTVTLKNGTVDADNGTSYAVTVGGPGVDTHTGHLTIESGSYYGACTAVNVVNGTATINGGYFEVTPASTTGDYRYLLNCYDSSYQAGNAKITVTGGTFKNFDPNDNLAESGGADFVPVDYGTIMNTDGTYGVMPADEVLVAEVNGSQYASITKAIEAANDGDTITIVLNHGLTETVVVDKDVTIDFNGCTVTTTGDINPAFRILANVTVTDSNVGSAHSIDSQIYGDGYCFIVGNTDTEGKLTINGGSYYGAASVVSVTKGEMSITGGEFYAEAADNTGDYRYLLNCYDPNYATGDAKIVVTGGTFHGFDPADNLAEGEGTNFVPTTHYTWKGDSAEGDWHVEVRTVVIVVDNVTATYGQQPTLTGKYYFKDDVTQSPTDITVNYMAPANAKDAGTYEDALAPYVSGQSQKIYKYEITNGTLTIAPKEVTIIVNDATKTYGDKDPGFTGTVVGLVENDTVTVTCTREAGEDAGEYSVTGSISDDNYKVTSVDAGTLTIKPKAVTVTVDDKLVTRGDEMPKLTYQIEGLVGNDELEVTLSCETDDTDSVGTYEITATVADDDNYAVTVVDGTLTVSAKPVVVITAADLTKTYGDKDPELTGTAVIEGSTEAPVGITISYSREAGENVGEYDITAAVTGAGAQDYEYTVVFGTLTIKPKTVSVTADDVTVKMGDKLPTLTSTISGLVTGDTLDVTLTTSAKDTKTPGTYVITVSVKANDNYKITVKNGVLTVSDLNLDTNGDGKADENIDGNNDGTPEYSIIKGMNGKYTKGVSTALKFTGNGTFNRFEGVKVDGKTVDAKHYTAVSGSTIVTLKTSYLNTLADGKHTLTIVYTDGEASCSFYIQTDPDKPLTGDNSSIGLWLGLIAVSAAVIGGTVFATTRKKGKHSR